MDKLQRNDLFLKLEKCIFHKKEVEYLGVIVGNGSVKMDPVKVKGLAKWPQLYTVKELWSFLGFGNYYKDFIANYSHIARPLHEMTKKSVKWNWGPKQEEAFQMLKALFTMYPVCYITSNRALESQMDQGDCRRGNKTVLKWVNSIVLTCRRGNKTKGLFPSICRKGEPD